MPRFTSAILTVLAFAGLARADLVAYDFTAPGQFLYSDYVTVPGMDEPTYPIEGRITYDPSAVGSAGSDGITLFATRGSLSLRIGDYVFASDPGGSLYASRQPDGSFGFYADPADPGPFGELGRSSSLGLRGVRPGAAGTLPSSLSLGDSLWAEVLLTNTYYDVYPDEPHVDVYVQGWGDLRALTAVEVAETPEPGSLAIAAVGAGLALLWRAARHGAKRGRRLRSSRPSHDGHRVALCAGVGGRRPLAGRVTAFRSAAPVQMEHSPRRR